MNDDDILKWLMIVNIGGFVFWCAGILILKWFTDWPTKDYIQKLRNPG